ncbi:hypothetical protein AAHH88_00280 [Candidatus Hodgkinia cicadicola]
MGCGLEASSDISPVVVRSKGDCTAQVLIQGVVECDDYVYPGAGKLQAGDQATSLL